MTACIVLNWPLNVAGIIMVGGCQECWEAECDASWWVMARALDRAFPVET